MSKYFNKRNFFLFLFLSLLIFVDQVSKYSVRQSGGFYICNKNIAWGIKLHPWLFWLFSALILTYVLFFLLKKGRERNAFFLALILAGAISNMADRFFLGCIIDFINLKFWPVFNLADLFITIGALGLLAKFVKSW